MEPSDDMVQCLDCSCRHSADLANCPRCTADATGLLHDKVHRDVGRGRAAKTVARDGYAAELIALWTRLWYLRATGDRRESQALTDANSAWFRAYHAGLRPSELLRDHIVSRWPNLNAGSYPPYGETPESPDA